jgi:uncharacterized protein (TIGR02284 family)
MQVNPVNPDSEKQAISQLNSFLRGEISAVETYRQALNHIKDNGQQSTLERCRRSHEDRVRVLSAEVRRLGGEPAQGSGVWGAFAKLVEGGAQVFGEKAAIAVLEEGEDHGRDDYYRDIDKLNPAVRQFVELNVLPEQERTHLALKSLKETMS